MAPNCWVGALKHAPTLFMRAMRVAWASMAQHFGMHWWLLRHAWACGPSPSGRRAHLARSTCGPGLVFLPWCHGVWWIGQSTDQMMWSMALFTRSVRRKVGIYRGLSRLLHYQVAMRDPFKNSMTEHISRRWSTLFGPWSGDCGMIRGIGWP